jgi:methylated-DNA-[protein]-cysteine S-methyltransferase
MNAPTQIYLGSLDDSPLGALRIAISPRGLILVDWANPQAHYPFRFEGLDARAAWDQPHVQPYADEIRAYLEGRRKNFDIPIDWSTLQPFQQKTLKAVYAIPYGQTRAYAEIAAQIGHPNAYRAVGRANATNPMPLVIPCHRVIGADGKLHGYGGGAGLSTKQWLLDMEARN